MKETERQALEYMRMAYDALIEGNIKRAIELYEKSINIHPTAQGYTYLAWAYSMLGNYELAIDLCKKAIEIDPDYGNPYNDIGSYLIALGRYEESIPWLKKAIVAKNYEPRHYPHMNLARAYLAMGKFYDALEEVNNAIRIAPNYKPAHILRHQILGMLN